MAQVYYNYSTDEDVIIPEVENVLAGDDDPEIQESGDGPEDAAEDAVEDAVGPTLSAAHCQKKLHLQTSQTAQKTPAEAVVLTKLLPPSRERHRVVQLMASSKLSVKSVSTTTRPNMAYLCIEVNARLPGLLRHREGCNRRTIVNFSDYGSAPV
jgi:hypothetical protein